MTSPEVTEALDSVSLGQQAPSLRLLQEAQPQDADVPEGEGPTLLDLLEVGSRRDAFEEALLDLLEVGSQQTAVDGTLPGLVLTLSVEGVCRAVTPDSRLDRWGLPERTLGRQIDDLFPVEVKGTARSCLLRVGETGQPQVFQYSIGSAPGTKHLEAHLAVGDRDGFVLVVHDITENWSLKHAALNLLAALSSSPEHTVKALLPVCAWCNKVRDEQDQWQEVEEFLREIAPASATHSICPDCKGKELDTFIASSPEPD